MSYAEEMQQSYKEVRARLGMAPARNVVKRPPGLPPKMPDEERLHRHARRAKKVDRYEAAMEHFSHLQKRVEPKVPDDVAKIMAEVAVAHSLTIASLRAKTNERKVSNARHEAMYRIRNEGGYSSPQIGQFFGGMDHTTVLYACAAYSRRKAMVG